MAQGPQSTWDDGQSQWDGGSSQWDVRHLTTAEKFRERFPAFKDPAVYSDKMIEDWLQLAKCVVGADAWGCLYELGIMLWAAHEMAKMRMAELAAEEDPTGLTGGQINSKSVGPVSVSYNTQNGMEDGAGQYNMTIYGRQFWHYARIVGIGPHQIGPFGGAGPLGTGASWQGPVFGVWPNWALIG